MLFNLYSILHLYAILRYLKLREDFQKILFAKLCFVGCCEIKFFVHAARYYTKNYKKKQLIYFSFARIINNICKYKVCMLHIEEQCTQKEEVKY